MQVSLSSGTRSRPNTAALLGISASAVLAVEELLLTSLADVDFFTFDELIDPLDPAKTNAPIERRRVDGERPMLDGGFQWLRTLGPHLGDALITTM